IEEKIPAGVILRGDCSREIVDLAYVDRKSETGSGLFFTIVLFLAALFLWSIDLPFVPIVLVLFCCVFGGVTAFMHAGDKYKKKIIRKHGPTEQGSVCTLIPKHNLILNFTWFGKEIDLSVCKKIPDDYYIDVTREVGHTGGDYGTSRTDNQVYLVSKSQKWRFYLDKWYNIESEEKAIERVSKQNWRNYLRAPVVFDKKRLMSYDQEVWFKLLVPLLLLAYVIWSWLG
ncbi:MAG: hypothetical protein VXZ80_00935, partial [Candidatus Thermoplasmatota archaeon]|nr:hypothetical protein [Candidatus Thermoplasmatota archaeon]